jgi:threonyl-tRNA synthetase
MAAQARAAGLRVEVDDAKQSVGKKIRAAQLLKSPYVVVIGDRDLEAGTFTVRGRDGAETPGLAFDRIVEALVAEAEARSLEPTNFAAV